MKKIYQNPTIKIVKIQTQQMLAESVDVGTTYNGETVLSRRDRSVWDDEDEEEDY